MAEACAAVLAAGAGALTQLNVGWHVTVKVAHKNSSRLRLDRAGYCSTIAALLIFLGCDSLQNAVADGETRTISLHHIHTHEDLTITYKVSGRYDENALAKINQFFRDWRVDQPIKMDPHLIDLLWEVHREVGAKQPISIICGYRAPSTNAMLRKRSKGVAKFSQHTQGKAIDFFIPGVPLDELRAAGLRAERGGVGYYPGDGFVHMDTGSVRHWPRMPEAQVASVLAKGQLSSHHASDPKGTAIARGDIRRSGIPPTPMVQNEQPNFLAKLFGFGREDDEEGDAERASKSAAKPSEPARASKPEPKAEKAVAVAAAAFVPLPQARPAKPETVKADTVKTDTIQAAAAALSATKPAVESNSASAISVPAPAPATYAVASASTIPVPVAQASVAPASSNKPAAASNSAAATTAPASAPATYAVASAAAIPVRIAQVQVARPNNTANDVISERGYWQGLPSAEGTDAAQSSVPQSTASRAASPSPQRRPGGVDPAPTASVAPWPMANHKDQEALPNALSYAAQPTPIAAARAVPMGTGTPRAAPPSPGEPTIVAKRSDERVPERTLKQDDRPAAAAPPPIKIGGPVRVGDRFNDPWMRAMIVSPSAQSFLRTTLFGMPDFRNLGPYLHKPASAVTMKFMQDPHAGMRSEKFAGEPVVFVSSETFTVSEASGQRTEDRGQKPEAKRQTTEDRKRRTN